MPQSGCGYIIGQTLYVDVLRLKNTNDLNFISLSTHILLVEEVRIHTVHLNHYLTSQRNPPLYTICKLGGGLLHQ